VTVEPEVLVGLGIFAPKNTKSDHWSGKGIHRVPSSLGKVNKALIEQDVNKCIRKKTVGNDEHDNAFIGCRLQYFWIVIERGSSSHQYI